MTSTLAIYGGSFDPPHVGHTLVCAYVLAVHPVDRVLVVPTLQHPFDKPLAPFAHRVRMCEIAMRDLRRVEVSRIEEQLPAPSLTLHTLRALAAQHPGDGLRLVMGSDLLAETASWHRFDEVEALAPPIVVPRAGHPGGGAPALPDVSSTEVRRRLRAGESLHGLVDRLVEQYARAQGLYR